MLGTALTDGLPDNANWALLAMTAGLCWLSCIGSIAYLCTDLMTILLELFDGLPDTLIQYTLAMQDEQQAPYTAAGFGWLLMCAAVVSRCGHVMCSTSMQGRSCLSSTLCCAHHG